MPYMAAIQNSQRGRCDAPVLMAMTKGAGVGGAQTRVPSQDRLPVGTTPSQTSRRLALSEGPSGWWRALQRQWLLGVHIAVNEVAGAKIAQVLRELRKI